MSSMPIHRGLALASCLGLGVACLTATGRADTIKLKSGSVLEGKIESEAEGKLRLRTEMGLIDVEAAEVASITRGPSPAELYQQIRKNYPNTADGHYRLAVWCREHHLAAK